MATVVYLSDFRRESRRTDAAPEQGATIHLFLGVRYERHQEEAAPQAPTRKGGGSRRSRKRA